MLTWSFLIFSLNFRCTGPSKLTNAIVLNFLKRFIIIVWSWSWILVNFKNYNN